MDTEIFIARRIFSDKKNKKSISQSIVRIAIIGIALGLAVMILSVAILAGFKSEIRAKVIGFGSHINITNYDTNSSYESVPISRNQPFYPSLAQKEGIKHVQVYATKAGIIKTRDNIQGIVLKGIDKDFDWSFFEKNIVEGESFRVSDTVSQKALISNYIAKRLKLKVGDDLFMYFIQDPPRMRKFEIAGIYDTGLEEYDKLFVIVDIKHIRHLNMWSEDQITGFEVLIDDFDQLDPMTQIVFNQAGSYFLDDGTKLKVRTIKQASPQIFDWLALTDTNVWVILILMTLVAGFNMVSGLLILILERTNMVGVLKALGYPNNSIARIFLYNAIFLVGKGMLWGNLIGVSLCLVQHYFGIVTLDPASYYVDSVPINLKIWHLALLNIGTLLATTLMLLLPSMVISRIKPIKAIRFN